MDILAQVDASKEVPYEVWCRQWCDGWEWVPGFCRKWRWIVM